MKNYLIIGLSLFVVILFVLRSCEKPIVKTNDVHFYDTIKQTDTIVKTITKEHYNLVPTYIEFNDDDTTKHTYTYNIEDSLLNATIDIKETDSYPLLDFKYKLKSFEINNTTIIKDSVYHEIERNKLFFGGGLVFDNGNLSPFIGLTFTEKHGHAFEVGVGSSQNANIFYHVGYKKLISFRKK